MTTEGRSETMAHVQDGKNSTQKFELIYFNFRGRAELARLLFAVKNVDYLDTRITDMHEWLSLKKELPFGQLPILKFGDKVLSQSVSIARYLAKQFDLCGQSDFEQAQCDMVVDTIMDVMDPIQPCYREKDQQKKVEMRESYEKLLPDFLARMEHLLESNDGGNGYFVGTEMTWADIAVMNAWHWIPGFGVFPKLHEYPKLDAHKERIESHPRIQAWLEARPTTPV